jgi:hypothetical protein
MMEVPGIMYLDFGWLILRSVLGGGKPCPHLLPVRGASKKKAPPATVLGVLIKALEMFQISEVILP